MFEFHHTGCLVESIEDSIAFYKNTFGFSAVSEIYNISEQKVRVCFIKNGENSLLELVQPEEGNKELMKMLQKRVSYYHVAYMVEDIESALTKIQDDVHLVSKFNSEAFQGKLCAFVYTRELHLIELIQK